jgi:hypothetical protein
MFDASVQFAACSMLEGSKAPASIDRKDTTFGHLCKSYNHFRLPLTKLLGFSMTESGLDISQTPAALISFLQQNCTIV